MNTYGKGFSSFRRICSFVQAFSFCLPCFLLTLLATPAESSLIKFEYDQAGNMTSEQGKYYEYNDANQLIRIRKDSPDGEILAEYVYDYQGQRVKKVENGVTTYYVGKYYEERKGATVNEKTNYFFANNQRIAKSSQKNKAPPEVSYYLNNHLGSADVVINEQGTQTDRIRYFPYGGYRTFPQEKHTFTGKERDEVTDNYYFEARYYNPNIRRFTQADTIVPDLYDPQSLNRYAYVKNNPLKYIDPTGHSQEEPITYEEFLQYAEGKSLSQLRNEGSNGGKFEQRFPGGPKDDYRFVTDPKSGLPIDMRHFLVVGQYGGKFSLSDTSLLSKIYNFSTTYNLGNLLLGDKYRDINDMSIDFAIEIYQAASCDVTGHEGNCKSALSVSDLLSNQLGRKFYKDYYNSKDKDFVKELRRFFEDRAKEEKK